MKLLVRIRERIEIAYITIVFVSVLVGFVITAFLAHITWALAREWVLSIRAAKTVIWVLTWELVLAQDTTVTVHDLLVYLVYHSYYKISKKN